VVSLTVVNAYLCANVLLAVAALLLAGIRALSRRLLRPYTYRHLLQLGYAILVAAMLLPLFGMLFNNERSIPHTAQVWSAPTMHSPARVAPEDHRIVMSLVPAHASIPLSTAAQVAGYVFASGLLMMLVRLAVDALAIARIIASSHVFRRRGRLGIFTSDAIGVPFSFWIPNRYFIVVPSSLVLRSADLRIAMRHEAQHHRQADTKLLYGCQLARALFYWNPFAHWLTTQILELQEFACDEAVIARRRTSKQDYVRSLLWVAEAATQRKQGPLQVRMAGGNPSALRRRIEAALTGPQTPLRKSAAVVVGIVAVAALSALSIWFATPIQDHRIGRADAERMALLARRASELPIVMNDRVLRQLNVLLGTPDGRAYLRASLARMEQFGPSISEQIKRYGLPPELIAVPMAESGYRNLPAGTNPRQGAGLWMFIESTARRFGLEITETTDERLNIPDETEAALRLLSDLHGRFNDWHLALLAYNTGQTRVEQAIRETGSRDAWQLARPPYENDRDYLARVMAMMVIIKNPGA
jgi:beta-lactamase regulating signal transducer with metallopeptidase domain